MALDPDPTPAACRKRLNHDFRDAQLGLAHPLPEGRTSAVGPPATEGRLRWQATATPMMKGTP